MLRRTGILLLCLGFVAGASISAMGHVHARAAGAEAQGLHLDHHHHHHAGGASEADHHPASDDPTKGSGERDDLSFVSAGLGPGAARGFVHAFMDLPAPPALAPPPPTSLVRHAPADDSPPKPPPIGQPPDRAPPA